VGGHTTTPFAGDPALFWIGNHDCHEVESSSLLSLDHVWRGALSTIDAVDGRTALDGMTSSSPPPPSQEEKSWADGMDVLVSAGSLHANRRRVC
jgi:hypothetical protein